MNKDKGYITWADLSSKQKEELSKLYEDEQKSLEQHTMFKQDQTKKKK